MKKLIRAIKKHEDVYLHFNELKLEIINKFKKTNDQRYNIAFEVLNELEVKGKL